MLEFLYTVFIMPLEEAMRFILEWTLTETGSPTLGLIAVSLAVSLGSLPLYHIAEQWQNREREIQKRLKPKLDEFKQVFSGATLNAYTHALYRMHRYHPIFALRAIVGLLIQIPFFFAAYHLLSHYEPFNGVSTPLFADLSKPDGWLFSINVMPFIMTGINILSAFVYGSKLDKKAKIQLYGIAALFLVVLYNSPSGLLFYWTMNNLFSLLKNVVYHFFESRNKRNAKKKQKTAYHSPMLCCRFSLFMLALFVLFSAMSLVPALMLMGTGGLDDFPKHLGYYLSYLIMWFFVGVAPFVVLYYYLSSRLRSWLTVFVLFAAFYATMNLFAFPAAYGEMSHFIFSDDNVAHNVFPLWSNIGAAIPLLVLSLASLRSRLMSRIALYSVSIIAIVFAVIIVKESVLFAHKRADYTEIKDVTDLKPVFTFSKTKKNVVVVMLDRFVGGYADQALKMIPDLNQKLDGFTWYRESLSTASCTIGGEPGIMGGWEYSVHNIQHARPTVPIREKLKETTRILPYNFTQAGYDVTVLSPQTPWEDPEDKQYIENVRYIRDLEGRYTKLWLKEHHYTIKVENVRAKLMAYAFFCAAPPAVRMDLYDNGHWLLDKRTKPAVQLTKKWVYYREYNKLRIKQAVDTWSAIDYLPKVSQVSDGVKPQFYYMTNMFPHRTYITTRTFGINPKGEVKYPRKLFNKMGHKIYYMRHLYTDIAILQLITKWFDWMKKTGVYDNTRIILVSDHGRWVYNPLFDRQYIRGQSKRGNSMPSTYNNLIMVKDFGSRGTLKIDDTFMANCDIPHLSLDGITQGVNPYTGNKIIPPKSKFPFYTYDLVWRYERLKKYKYRYYKAFKIKGPSIFNTSNWRRYYDK